ncbi:hypothetical protein N2152v2_010723 [Parachlorella kessleri]
MAALDHPTGDAPGTLEALRTDLNHIKYPHGLNSVRALAGDAAELLPVLSFALLRFSRHVALLCQDYQLHGKTDQRFVDAAWKFLRDGLGLPKLALTPTQFLSEGFAERKLLLLRQIIRACKDHHNAAARKDRLAALKGNTHSEQRLYLSPQQRQQQPATSKQPVPRPAPAKPVPFPLEQQGGLHAQQHGAASSLAAAYQTVLVDQPAMALALLGQQYSTPDVATLRLIEDLHLRLKLAEEAALEARHSSEAMQEGLQARLAVLEGRVKFLEGGFGLQPLQLPWGACCSVPEERVTVVTQQPKAVYTQAAYTPAAYPTAAPAYGAPAYGAPGYAPPPPGYYAQPPPPPAYYTPPPAYAYPQQQTVVVQEQRSGMSTGGAALLGGVAGLGAGVLIGEALAGPHYGGFGGTTIVENNTYVDNTTIVDNGGWGGDTVVVDNGWGGDTVIVDDNMW